MDEDPYYTTVIVLDPTKYREEISGVPPPEHPAELPGLTPPLNDVEDDIVPPLLMSDYDSEYYSGDEDEDA